MTNPLLCECCESGQLSIPDHCEDDIYVCNQASEAQIEQQSGCGRPVPGPDVRQRIVDSKLEQAQQQQQSRKSKTPTALESSKTQSSKKAENSTSKSNSLARLPIAKTPLRVVANSTKQQQTPKEISSRPPSAGLSLHAALKRVTTPPAAKVESSSRHTNKIDTSKASSSNSTKSKPNRRALITGSDSDSGREDDARQDTTRDDQDAVNDQSNKPKATAANNDDDDDEQDSPIDARQSSLKQYARQEAVQDEVERDIPINHLHEHDKDDDEEQRQNEDEQQSSSVKPQPLRASPPDARQPLTAVKSSKFNYSTTTAAPQSAFTPARSTTNHLAQSQSTSTGRKQLGMRRRLMPTTPSTMNSSQSASRPLAEAQRALAAKLAEQRVRALEQFNEEYADAEGEDPAYQQSTAYACTMHNGVQIERAPLMPQLSVLGHENPNSLQYRKPFTVPRRHKEPTPEAQRLMADRQRVGRRLGARPGGAHLPLAPPMTMLDDSTSANEDALQVAVPAMLPSAETEPKIEAKKGVEPLVIWRLSEDAERQSQTDKQWNDCIEVPTFLCNFLRPHQREGVQFLAECMLGMRRFKGNGAILADDMGLGKTLQSVALLYLLLSQGFEKGRPICRRVVIITPTSLVGNWSNELTKWLDKRIESIALSESGKDKIEKGIDAFLYARSKASVLILSYECFLRNVKRFVTGGGCDLMICDEAHRLKNDKTSTYAALDSVPCTRRCLLSGTPLQNDLSEFFAMINFTNRNSIGDKTIFKRYYEGPILAGREPDATPEEREHGAQKSSEMSAIVNQFVLRRTNVLLSKHLPPKVVQIVCCRPTQLQLDLYHAFVAGRKVQSVIKRSGPVDLNEDQDDGGGGGKAKGKKGKGGGGRQGVLPLITDLKKLCNHPKLIYDHICEEMSKLKLNDGSAAKLNQQQKDELATYESMSAIFKQHEFTQSPWAAKWGGKMYLLDCLLQTVRKVSKDRWVLISNYTSALDVFEKLCETRGWKFLRLDGSTSVKARQKLVDELCDLRNQVYIFLLSSRAGGCGLNLIGANRLVLFDPDWNPAVDKQAAARVWRDGQQKRCFVYRFLTTGSIEEKIYQRQISKEGLAGVLGGQANKSSMSSEELKDLFRLRDARSNNYTPSDTHDTLDCSCLGSILQTKEEIELDRKARAEAEASKMQIESSTDANAQAQGAEEKLNDLDLQDDEHPVADATHSQGADSKQQPAIVECNEDAPQSGSDAESRHADNDDDDDQMDDFIANESSDDDCASNKKRSTANKKPKKSDRKRMDRSHRLTARMIDCTKLPSLTHALLGQRGEPPEEELINWAHHIAPHTVPDPLFRRATQQMAKTRDGWPFVSFAFSCEVQGKALGAQAGDDGVDKDAQLAQSVSARCDDAPVVMAKEAAVEISVEQAYAKHETAMKAAEQKRKKRLGLQSDDDIGDASKPRRHSSRHEKTREAEEKKRRVQEEAERHRKRASQQSDSEHDHDGDDQHDQNQQSFDCETVPSSLSDDKENRQNSSQQQQQHSNASLSSQSSNNSVSASQSARDQEAQDAAMAQELYQELNGAPPKKVRAAARAAEPKSSTVEKKVARTKRKADAKQGQSKRQSLSASKQSPQQAQGENSNDCIEID